MGEDVINMVNKNHEEYKEQVTKALNESNRLKNRVSNSKGEVIGIVTFDLDFLNKLKNKMNYIFNDRKRTQELLAKFAFAGAFTIGVVSSFLNISESVTRHNEAIQEAQFLSNQKVMSALETPTLDDDQNILDYYLSSVPKDTTNIKPDDRVIIDRELRTRLENLQKKIESLRSSETLGVDIAALTAEYKKEYAAIIQEMEAKGFYYQQSAIASDENKQKL